MTACSLSEVLAEGVECDRWVWWASGAGCIVVLGSFCCFVGFYWDLLCCRRKRRSSAATGAKAGKGKSLDGGVPPPVLHVDSPNQHKECSGSYELLQGRQVNGHPIWQKRSMERWLYSGFDGRWYICGPATKERNFDCASGYIYNSTFHKGILPHRLGSSWEWSGGLQWHRDVSIAVSMPDPDEEPSPRRQLKAYAQSERSEIFIVGPHNMSVGAGLKTMPIAENKQQHFGHSVGTFCEGEAPTVVGAAQPKDTEAMVFERYKASRSKSWSSIQGVLDKFGGAKKDNMSDDSTLDSSSIQVGNCDTSTEGSGSLKSPRSWQPSSPAPGLPWSGAAVTRSDTSDSTSNTSSRRSMYKEPPQLLCVITPNGQRECAGTYEFVSGETANGHPLWKQQDSERWLYSSTTGRWCIGGQDVKEENFQRHAGYISQTAPHKGTTPDRTSSIWQRWNGEKFEKDTRITVVQLHPPRNKDPESRRPKDGEKLDLRGKSADDSLKRNLREDEVAGVVV